MDEKLNEIEQRDYQWLFDSIRIIIGDVVNPLEKKIDETTHLQKETRDKLNSKVEILIQDNIRINTLEKKFEEEKDNKRFNWTQILAIISTLIALSGLGIIALSYLKGGFISG